MRNTCCLVLLILSLAACPATRGQEKLTEHTFALSAGESPPPATLADIAWLAGHWRGTGLRGLAEEMWSEPLAGSMVGWFRLVRDGAPAFYELELLVETAGTLVLKVKHFGTDFAGWEEKDETVDFPLVATEARAMHFERCSFVLDGDHLTLFLAIRQKDGTYREEIFNYTRVTGG
jgi:hypothetical protein